MTVEAAFEVVLEVEVALEVEVVLAVVLAVEVAFKNTVLNRSSSNVRKVYGSIRVCGKISPVQSAFGLIWTTLM